MTSRDKEIAGGPLSSFSPFVAGWFTRRYGAPTAVQAAAWPRIAAGRHVLLSAPTGSGKTLAAFLYAIDHLLTGAWELGATRVLYVSPLKALNNDIQRNLLTPLSELAEVPGSSPGGPGFGPAAGIDSGNPGIAAVERLGRIRVMTRSGDTPQTERERMRRKPPEILITTPESLNLLLSSPRSVENLCEIRTVVLDEIHAVAGSKRGTHLMTAVERLTRLSGEFQRIAISATVRPIQTVADYVAGGPKDTPRPIEVVNLGAKKRHQIEVRFVADSPGGNPGEPGALKPGAGGSEAGTRAPDPDGPPEAESPPLGAASPPPGGEPFWEQLVPEIRRRVLANRSTLIFTTNRRHAEKLAMLLNRDQLQLIAFAHHGSLSREVRLGVEERMKQGVLRSIVATSSLELGIDVGAVEEVIFLKTPLSLTSTLQMAGRSGHQVGAVSRSTFYPLFGRDLVDTAVAAGAVEEGWIEETHPPEAPLDVLAQVVLSMVGTQEWYVEEMLALLRCSYPYRNLTRKQLELVLSMLAGKYAGTRIRELGRRIYYDKLNDRVTAPRESLRLIYHSGGTIPDRGYYGLKVRGKGVRLGELDEEFVWERKPGESFVFGNTPWKIVEIGDKDVEVVPAGQTPRILPFWRGESLHRRVEFADRVLAFLGEADRLLQGGEAGREGLRRKLEEELHFEATAAETLIAFLEGQRGHTGVPLPSASHLLIEETYPHQSKTVRHLLIVSLFGGVVNYPLGLLLEDEIESRFGPGASVFSDNDSIVIQTDAEEPTVSQVAQILRELPTSYQAIELALRRRLEGSGLFGTRFRENAGRALLLPRAGFDRRTPLWVNRMRARGLLQAVSGIPDFPITAETWRSCLEEDFDLPSVVDRLSDIREARIRISTVETETPSPFSKSTLWAHSNLRMYETDEPRGKIAQSTLSSEIIREIALDPRLRPEIPKGVAESFQARVQRLLPGYAPASKEELIDWVKERLAIPREEWEALRSALSEGLRSASEEPPEELVMFDAGTLVTSLERLPELGLLLNIDQAAVAERSGLRTETVRRAFEARPLERPPGDETQRATELLLEWLAFYGPLRPEYIRGTLTIDPIRLQELLSFAKEEEAIVDGLDKEGSLCEFRNYESILRILRRRGRKAVESLPATELLPFLREYRRRQLSNAGGDLPGAILTAFEGYSAPVDLWDTELLPTAIPDFRRESLEELFRNRRLSWVGTGRRRITLIAMEDLELIRDERRGRKDGALAGATAAGDAFGAGDGPRNGSPGNGDEPTGAGDPFPDTSGWYAYQDLLGRGTESLRTALWNLAWEGRATSDSFDGLRRELSEKRDRGADVSGGGLASDGVPQGEARGRRLRRGSRYRGGTGGRRRTGLSGPGRYQGLWRRLPDAAELFEGYDAYDFEELNRDRARLLLDRYGIVFRELLAPELPALSWGRVFRSLRLMELAGEVVGGIFFEGVPGIQFTRPETAKLLSRWPEETAAPPARGLFRLNAMDPISLCGRSIGQLEYDVPPRVAGTSLIYDGGELLAVARRGGSDLTLRVAPDDSRMPDLVELLKDPINRPIRPTPRLIVRSINQEPAAQSAFAPTFSAAGFKSDQEELVFWAPYQ